MGSNNSWSKILLVGALFLTAAGSSASITLLRGGSGILKNPAAERVLSRLLGVSPARLAGMGADRRRELLDRELEQVVDKKLATDIEGVFRGISEGRPGMEERVEELLSRLPQKKISVRDFLNKSGGNSGDALELLRTRVQKGEFPSAAVEEFSATVGSAGRALGFNILGSGAANCLRTFSPPTVGRFMSLISSLRTPGALGSVGSAYKSLVAGSERVFGDTLAKARDRVCALAGRSGECHLLAPPMCAR